MIRRLVLTLLVFTLAVVAYSNRPLPGASQVAPFAVPAELPEPSVALTWSGPWQAPASTVNLTHRLPLAQQDGLLGYQLSGESSLNLANIQFPASAKGNGETVLIQIRLAEQGRAWVDKGTTGLRNLFYGLSNNPKRPSHSLWLDVDKMTYHYSGATGSVYAGNQSAVFERPLWIASVLSAPTQEYLLYQNGNQLLSLPFVQNTAFEPLSLLRLGKGTDPNTGAEGLVSFYGYWDRPLSAAEIRSWQEHLQTQQASWETLRWTEQVLKTLFWALLLVWILNEWRLLSQGAWWGIKAVLNIWHRMSADPRRHQIEQLAQEMGVAQPGMDLEQLQLAVISAVDPTLRLDHLTPEYLDGRFDQIAAGVKQAKS